ncbi:MAG TPA: carbamoyltransferase HypF [Rhodocyclaceae bacterium]|nr:carbamoyltransferase HypF [Rhodocyclaceae bacterium]
MGAAPALLIDCRLRVRGIVQGVGMRPHVWRLARELGLAGWVRNDAAGVDIALSGRAAVIDRFVERLSQEAPRLARIDAIERCDEPYAPANDADFRILDSQGGAVQTAIGPDSAVCADCLGEIFDPGHRRYRYAFTTCTHCGPRYTIARGLPYDRASTSLAPFPLCPACAAEYADPAERRFHAEATCCPVCGPRLDLRHIDGTVIAGDPLAETLRLLRAGRIVAIKGLGGFHLVCDARNADAVATLRQRKAREAKPLAVMAASAAVLAPYATATADELALLSSAAAPVVLLTQTAACADALPGIAPGVGTLGAMLPNTPLQWLLFHEAAGRPAGREWIAAAPPELILVMTSANPQGEPLVITDAEAFERLAGALPIADAVLGHNRAIVARADDSVIRAGIFIRRGRGYTPQAIKLAAPGPSVLAFGGWFKNTVCLTRGAEAFVSTHIGDLDNAATCRFLDETVDRMLALTGIDPEIVAHDRHPDFYSTRAAQAFAAQRGLPLIAVQHHHAHLAAVAAEHGLVGPTPGLALDGIGLGDDTGDGVTAWGGELLTIDGARFARLGHLAPLALPGGDRAAREPWRMGAAALWALGRGEEIARRYAEQPAAATVRQMLERRLHCPLSSSAGRLFDAAAGLLGLQPVARFEAQAAMALEALATAYGESDGGKATPAAGWTLRDGVLDFSPLLQRLADEKNVARGAALFHEILAAGLVALVRDRCAAGAARGGGQLLVAGGCALNRLLIDKLRRRLDAAGVQMIEARAVPPGDGGLSLGQAWVAQRSKV